MRLVIAKCSVDYVGRLSAHLPLAVRLLMVKADGSVSIHADDRAYKPLNWMSPPCKLQEAPGVWKVVNKAGEELRITLEEIFQDTSYDLGVDPIGPVDLLLRDANNGAIAVEVKRSGDIDGVEQLTRYLELMNRDPLLAPVAGVFAAQEIKPQARVLATDRGIRCVVVDYDKLRGMERDELTLF